MQEQSAQITYPRYQLFVISVNQFQVSQPGETASGKGLPAAQFPSSDALLGGAEDLDYCDVIFLAEVLGLFGDGGGGAVEAEELAFLVLGFDDAIG